MDELLAELVREAEADEDTLALSLVGSRSVRHEREDSDYDVYYVRRVSSRGTSATGSHASCRSAGRRTSTSRKRCSGTLRR